MSGGVGPPSPLDAAAALQPGMMLSAEREGAVGTAPCPAAPASRLWYRAFLLLAVCLCATAVPYSLGALATVTWDPLDSSASQQGVGESLVTACEDLLTSDCFSGLQGVVTPGLDEEGQSLGMQTVATLTSQTVLEWQSGSGDREGLGLGTAVTLSPAQWPGKRVPATSSLLFQTEDVPSLGSWLHLTRGGLHRAGPVSHGATQMPAVTSAGGLGQPAGTAEPPSPQRGSEATSRAWSEPATGLPAMSQVWLHLPSFPTAASGPSAGAAVMQVAPTQLVPLQGATASSQVPPEVPTWTMMDAGSWSPSTAEQLVASALSTPRTPNLAELHPSTVGVPPALTPEGLWGTAGTALSGKAAPVLAQVPGNQSELLDAVLTSLPTTATAPGAHSQGVLPSSLPTAQSGAPAVTLGTQNEWPSPPAQPMSPGASIGQTRTPSPAGPTMTRMSSTATGVIPELGQMLVMEESRTAPVGPVPTPAGPPGPTRASPRSVPHLCSRNPTLECGSEPGHHAATSSSVTSPSCLPTSPGAGHAASSLLSSQSLAVPTGVILDAHIMSSSSSTSQHSSAAVEHLPAATRQAFSPAELMKGQTGSSGTKPPVSHPSSLPFPTQPVHVLPLQFCLLGIAYTPALGSRNSESYQQLERDVRLLVSAGGAWDRFGTLGSREVAGRVGVRSLCAALVG